jgi:virginiamycin B lyase
MPSAARSRPALLVALASAAMIAACSQPTVSVAPSSATPSETASPVPTPSASTIASIDDLASAALEEVAGEPDWPLEGFGSLWLLAPDQEEPSLLRVDPMTNEIVATVGLPGNLCQGFTVSDDAVWVCTPSGAARVDPTTNEIVGEVAFDTGEVFSRLAFGDGSVWAIGTDGGVPNTLVRIDPATMTATPIPLGHGAATLAYGFDAVWVTAPQEGVLLRVDPATNAVTEHVTGLARPWAVVAGPDSLWVTLFASEDIAADEPTVVRIDPADATNVVEIATGATSENAGGLWATADAVWVRAPEAFLTRIDPATNQVVEVIDGPVSAGDVTVAFGSVWATASNSLTVYRLTP